LYIDSLTVLLCLDRYIRKWADDALGGGRGDGAALPPNVKLRFYPGRVRGEQYIHSLQYLQNLGIIGIQKNGKEKKRIPLV
jgi:hypothetical protein